MQKVLTTSSDRVFLDLDGVVANIEDEIALRIKRDYHRDVDTKSFLHFDIAKNVDVSEGWVMEQIHDPTFFLNAIPFPDAWFWCNHYFSKGFDIIFLTCRPKEMQKVSERWLDEWQIGYNKVVAGIPRGRKMDYIEDGCLFVEDNAYEAWLASVKSQAYILDKPYNRQEKYESVDRIDSLLDIRLEREKIAT